MFSARISWNIKNRRNVEELKTAVETLACGLHFNINNENYYFKFLKQNTTVYIVNVFASS